MTGDGIFLGSFSATELIGRGGMAEVWRGVHREQQVPVAIKVITALRAQEPRFLATFRTEVQSVARLDHPGIVMVLDHGVVPEEAEAKSRGKIVAGSPFLVMELASMGSLDRVRNALDWRELVKTLLALLDALAHAHARGVIHRDLKPANVLLGGPRDLRPGLKLTDFGIAHALGEDGHPSEHEATATSGTPHYMAPEQFLAQWRDYGPWTDLYALGCMTHVLAAGRPPFEGKGPMQVAWAHINAEPSPLRPQHPVPPTLETWVQRLLAKDPRDRFQRAADAAWALRKIEEDWRTSGGEALAHAHKERKIEPIAIDDPLSNPPVFEPPAETELQGQEKATAVIARYQFGETPPKKGTLLGEELATLIEETFPSGTLPWWNEGQSGLQHASYQRVESSVSASIRLAPPMPPTWRQTTPPAPSLRLVGAGLGLYGLRSIPMVDRDKERDLIWQALGAARKERQARAVVLVGAAGHGKSRLVEWICERADEVGSAFVLKATHGPIAGPADGLPRMIARHLRTIDLAREEVLDRVKRQLITRGVSDEYEWRALTELVSPSTEDDRLKHRAVRFGGAKERHLLVRRFLDRWTEERPVIVWLDDVQWGADAITFATHVVKESCAPILLLLTAREELLPERPHENELLQELLRHPYAHRTEVGPLSAQDHQRLVQELLSLEPGLAQRVAERTNGNPLFAVQLVGDWVQRGVLELGKSGFRLEKGEKAALPDNIHQVWSTRIEQVLSKYPETARLALEIASVLGGEVDAAEWKQTCQHENVPVLPTLMLDLIASRLAEPTQAGWMFSHGMVRESLERSAGNTWRWREHHLAAAAMLRRQYGLKTRGVAERIGRHLTAAEAYEASLEPLLTGAIERWETSDYSEAHELLDERERALERLGKTNGEEAAQGWLLRARNYLVQGRFEDAKKFVEKAAKSGLKSILPEAHRLQGAITYERGDHERARELYQRALELFEDNGDHQGTVRSLMGLGDVAYRLGDLEQAEQLYQRTHDLAEPVEDETGVADALWGLGYVALWRGDLKRAEACFKRQLSSLEALGSQLGAARCWNSLGEVARLAGDLPRAEEFYRHALSIHRTIGTVGTMVTQLNLAMVLLGKGDFESAEKELASIFERFGETEERGHLCAAWFELLPCRAEKQDWPSWDECLERGVRLLEETALKDGDVAWTLQLAGDRAWHYGERTRAKRAYTLAIEMWRALGRSDKVAEVEKALTSTDAR